MVDVDFLTENTPLLILDVCGLGHGLRNLCMYLYIHIYTHMYIYIMVCADYLPFFVTYMAFLHKY